MLASDTSHHTTRFDTIIVGSGPSAAALARELSARRIQQGAEWAGIKGLYVCDASVIPDAWVTLLALGQRMAERLACSK